jgi:probable rRNA maturation factor
LRSLYLGPWRIDVEWREDVPRLLPATSLARAVVAALDAARAPRPASLGLILSDDAELAELNLAHMGKEGPTDVLSFPLLPPEAYPSHPGKAGAGEIDEDAGGAGGPEGGSGGVPDFPLPPGSRPHLGDIVVSVERAIDQAEAGRGGHTGAVRWDARDELRLLVTHGALHVCGWDHAEPEEEAAMRALERGLLAGSGTAGA